MIFIKGSRVYLDSNLWIYLLEPPPEIEVNLLNLFEQIKNGQVVPVTSTLSWAECLIKPLREKDLSEKAWFDQIFKQTAGLQLLEITQEILFLAAEIRAETNIKTPDAIHLASAKSANCDVFLTHDSDLRKDSLKTVMHPLLLHGIQ